jgi:hypothetical protein
MSSFLDSLDRTREKAGKSPPRRVSLFRPRRARPRASASWPLLSRMTRQMMRRLEHDPDWYRQLGDYLMYAGVVAVLVIATWMLISGR